MSEFLQAPWGRADEQSITAASTMAATISNSESLLTISALSAASTLNLTVVKGVGTGAKLYVKASADASQRTLSFGTGFSAPNLVLPANSTYVITFVYNASTEVFEQVARNVVSAITSNLDQQSKTFASTIAATINRPDTFITLATLSGDATVNLTVDAVVLPGARLFIKSTSDGTARTLTFGTGFTAKALAGTISKSNVSSFIYDGTNFVNTGTQILS